MMTVVRPAPLGSIVLLITCYRLVSSQTCDPQAPYSCDLDTSLDCNKRWTIHNFYEAPQNNCYAGRCLEVQQNKSTLTSTLACKTISIHCLSFYHKFVFTNNKRFTVFLNITSVDTEGNTLALYNTLNANSNTTWTLHQINITTAFDFIVVFTHIIPEWGGASLIDEIEYARFECNGNASGTTVPPGSVSTLSQQDSPGPSSNPGGIAAAIIIIVFFIALLVVLIILYRRGKLPFLKKLPCHKHNLDCLSRQDKHGAEPSQVDGYEVPQIHVKDMTISGPFDLQTTSRIASGPHAAAGDKTKPGWAPTGAAVPSEPAPGPPGGYHSYPLGPTLENDADAVYNEPDDEIYHTIADSESSEASFDEDDDAELPQHDVQRAPEVDVPGLPALYQTPRKSSEPRDGDGAGVHQSEEGSDDVTPSDLYHVLENRPRDHDESGTPDRNSVYHLAKTLESATPPPGDSTHKPDVPAGGKRQDDYNRLQLKDQRSRGGEDGPDGGENKGKGKVYNRLAGDDYHAVNLEAKQTVIDGDYSHIHGHSGTS